MASLNPGRAAVWKLSPPSNSHPPESPRLPDDGSGGSGESIFGEDRRRLVDRKDFQDGGRYRSIVKVYARFDVQGGPVWVMGTGWLIRPDLLVTAGHVIYDWGRRYGAAAQIQCFIGYSGRESINNPWVQVRHGTNVATTAEWVDSSDNRSKDVAFIQLDRPFTGNLCILSYTNTPPTGQGILGVVGYPGDKALQDRETGDHERGAQMYEEFATTNYDIAKSRRHMVEYSLSTFAGQGGAPILRNGQLIAIGTHCYSADDDGVNSGSSIGNSYGSNYDAFISLFNNRSIFGEGGKIRIVDTSAQTRGAGEREEPNQHRAFMTSRPPVSDEEGFMDTLKSVAKVGSKGFPSLSPFLGPIGGPISAVIGGVLGSLAGSELSEGTFIAGNGAAERAILAEASLQTVLACDQSEELMEVITKMQDIWQSRAPQIDSLVPAVAPVVVECGPELAAQQPEESGGFEERESSFESQRYDLGVDFENSFRGEKTAFVQGLMGPTQQLAGQEGMVDWLGPVLKTAVSAGKPITSPEASSALSSLGRAINETSIASNVSNTNQEATKMLLQRAVLADTALQALVTLPRTTLVQLTPANIETNEQGFFDFMKGAIKKLGPAVQNAAQDAARKHGPRIIDAAKRHSESQPGFSGGPSPPVQIRGKKTSLLEALNQ